MSGNPVISLIVAVVFVESCHSVELLNFLGNPIDYFSSAMTPLSNLNFPLRNPRPKIANTDSDFQYLFDASSKKIVVIVFRKEYNVNKGKDGLRSFDDKFLNKIAREYRDADVIKVNTEKCQKTAADYGVPESSNNVHFAVNFRLSADDYIDPHITDIVDDLLKESNANKNKLTKDQILALIDSLKADFAIYNHLDVPAKIQKLLNNFLQFNLGPGPHSFKQGAGEVTINKLTSLSEYNGLGTIIEIKTIVIQVDSDEELNASLWNKSQEYIILFYTNNSLDDCDLDVRTFLNTLSEIGTGLKIIQVNANSGNCEKTISEYGIESFPTFFFLKRGKMHVSRVSGFDLDAIEAEISILLSNVELIDSDLEFVSKLKNRSSESIVINFTDNSLNKSDCQMKKYLSLVSNGPSGIKVVQVNVNTGQCSLLLTGHYIDSYPTLIFTRRGKMLSTQVHGYNERAIGAEMGIILSSVVIVNSDQEFTEALSNAKNELIVMLVTDNSLTSCDCEMKEYLSKLSLTMENIKVIQLNANVNKCPKTISEFGIVSFPTVLFMKYSKIQVARVTNCNSKAIDDEVSNLLSRSIVVNNEDELYEALANAEEERVIVFFTYNTLDKCDSVVKKYLSCLSHIVPDIKIIQVNANTELILNLFTYFKVKFYPSLAFIKHGLSQRDLIVGYDEEAIMAAISKLLE